MLWCDHKRLKSITVSLEYHEVCYFKISWMFSRIFVEIFQWIMEMVSGNKFNFLTQRWHFNFKISYSIVNIFKFYLKTILQQILK